MPSCPKAKQLSRMIPYLKYLEKTEKFQTLLITTDSSCLHIKVGSLWVKAQL